MNHAKVRNNYIIFTKGKLYSDFDRRLKKKSF